MHFDDFASLDVLKVDLPLLRVLAQGTDFGLEFGDLVLGELLERAHDFLDSCHFLGQGLIRHSSMLD